MSARTAMAIAITRRQCGSWRNEASGNVLAEIPVEPGGIDGDRARWRGAAQERLGARIVGECPDGDAAGVRRNEAEAVDDIGQPPRATVAGTLAEPMLDLAGTLARSGKELDKMKARWNLAVTDDLVIEAAALKMQDLAGRRLGEVDAALARTEELLPLVHPLDRGDLPPAHVMRCRCQPHGAAEIGNDAVAAGPVLAAELAEDFPRHRSLAFDIFDENHRWSSVNGRLRPSAAADTPSRSRHRSPIGCRRRSAAWAAAAPF